MKKSPYRLIPVFCAIMILFAFSSLGAQSIWQDPTSWEGIFIEFLKPHYADEIDLSFLTSVTFLSARFPMTRNINFSGELPFSYIKWDIPQGPDLGAQQTFGNPYFGLEYHPRRTALFFELGVRAPLATGIEGENGEATINGGLTDFVDRAEAFATNAIPVTGFVNYIFSSRTGFSLRLRGGPSFWFASGDREESETFIMYSAQVFYETDIFRFGGGFSGRYSASMEDGDFGERSMHQLTFGLDIILGMFRPGAYIRIPLDEEYKEIIDTVIGISLGIDFD
ncbi:MAG: hypothetical protein JSV17_17125 [Candidatus Aminicenantes bacterium]|nr:MAG: hypothetical protein JSV17_17125 [Candidatus Aminicenantes bacterium]